MWQARLRLAALWLSATCRVIADWALRLAPLAAATQPIENSPTDAWNRASILAIFPFVLFAPFNGVIANCLPRRAVLVGASCYTFFVLVILPAMGIDWAACLAVVAIGSAVYSPARFAELPAAARDTRMPLPRVNGLFEIGSAAGIVGGIMLGWHLNTLAPASRHDRWEILTLLNFVCLLAAFPASFSSDVIRRESPGPALAGFFRDLGRVLHTRGAAGSLLGLAAFQAIVTAGAGTLIGRLTVGGHGFGDFLRVLLVVGAGAAVGSSLASWQGNAYRCLGLVPFGATGMLLALAWGSWSLHVNASLPMAACALLGFTAGFVNVPLRAAYMAAVPADARGNAMAVMNIAIYLCIVLVAAVMLGAAALFPGQATQWSLLVVLCAVGSILSWYWLLQHAVEQVLELILAPIYRIRSFGPGADRVPERGPLLIVANHSSYMDPFWIGKIMPRHVTPMMTSLFYDLPVVHWLMVHFVGAIRVPTATFRREAPELNEAIRILRSGGCVLVFPEAILRRSEEQLLRPFGQGIWHILHALPETPVQPCWIEGGWGSYMSYSNGPPMQNKRFDFWRRIRIGVDEARPLDPAILVDHRTTRAHLMQAVLGCRRHLGLPVPVDAPAGDLSHPLVEKESH